MRVFMWQCSGRSWRRRTSRSARSATRRSATRSWCCSTRWTPSTTVASLTYVLSKWRGVASKLTIPCRIDQIYSTLGGLDNLRTARKHYSHSIELNKQQNLRAYLGLVACTKAIASHRNYRADQDDNGLNERLLQFALDFLQQFYASQATPELAEVGTTECGYFLVDAVANAAVVFAVSVQLNARCRRFNR